MGFQLCHTNFQLQISIVQQFLSRHDDFLCSDPIGLIRVLFSLPVILFLLYLWLSSHTSVLAPFSPHLLTLSVSSLKLNDLSAPA